MPRLFNLLSDDQFEELNAFARNLLVESANEFVVQRMVESASTTTVFYRTHDALLELRYHMRNIISRADMDDMVIEIHGHAVGRRMNQIHFTLFHRRYPYRLEHLGTSAMPVHTLNTLSIAYDRYLTAAGVQPTTRELRSQDFTYHGK